VGLGGEVAFCRVDFFFFSLGCLRGGWLSTAWDGTGWDGMGWDGMSWDL
jgi:hypothetical protein